MSIQSSERNCMNESAARAVDFIKRLDNSERLKLLCRLSQGECHGQLEKECSIRLPTLSQQLGVQRRGADRTEKRRQTDFLSSSDDPVMEIMVILHRHFCRRQEM